MNTVMPARPGPDDKVYRVVKLPGIVQALADEGVPAARVLARSGLSPADLLRPATRISLDQLAACYRNAVELTSDRFFALHAGLRVHVSTFGMYGFALLSSTDFRKAMAFAAAYHQLTTPLVDLSFREEGGCGVWTVTPMAHPGIDARLYRFLVELQFGMMLSLHRDIMGPGFRAREVRMTYAPAGPVEAYTAQVADGVLFKQAANQFRFDSSWLDRSPAFGSPITYQTVVELCDQLMEEFNLRIGLVGKVRHILLSNMMRPTAFDAVARQLNVSPRTLRRKLADEKTTFRALTDELRRDIAVKYLRDTDLSIEAIAAALGFSDSVNFRRAFRRWTKTAPQHFRAV